jgi:hypothetical protein
MALTAHEARQITNKGSEPQLSPQTHSVCYMVGRYAREEFSECWVTPATHPELFNKTGRPTLTYVGIVVVEELQSLGYTVHVDSNPDNKTIQVLW